METTSDMKVLPAVSGRRGRIHPRPADSRAALGRDLEQIGNRMAISTLRATSSRRGIPSVNGIVGLCPVLPIARNSRIPLIE
jgi:hypothetical protein